MLTERTLVAYAVCGALEYAQAHGVLHGDLHAKNVLMVSRADEYGVVRERPVLIDFGTSLFAGEDRAEVAAKREITKLYELLRTVLPELRNVNVFSLADVRVLEAPALFAAWAELNLLLCRLREALQRGDDYGVRQRCSIIGTRLAEHLALDLEQTIAQVRAIDDDEWLRRLVLAHAEAACLDEPDGSPRGRDVRVRENEAVLYESVQAVRVRRGRRDEEWTAGTEQ